MKAMQRRSPKRRHGYTLIELALVVGVLGLLAIAITDFYLGQLNLDRANRRIEGTVRDVQTILDASVQWKEADTFSHWPNDIFEILTEPLVDDGYLPFIPKVRYFECPMGCGEYEITGWDRKANPLLSQTGDYDEDPMEAEDLVIFFNVWGTGDARLIASQLPNGMVLPPQGAQIDNDERTIEARLTKDYAAGQYMRLRNETRAVVFGQVAEPGEPREPSGDLQGVASITLNTHDDPQTATGPGIRLRELDPDTLTQEGWEVGMLDDDGSRLVFDTMDPAKRIEAQGGLVVRDGANQGGLVVRDGANHSIELQGSGEVTMRDDNEVEVASLDLELVEERLTNLEGHSHP